MSDVDPRVLAALRQLLSREVSVTPATRLVEDLGLDSASLIELTVIFHTLYGVDLGRAAAEMRLAPETIGDVALLLGKT